MEERRSGRSRIVDARGMRDRGRAVGGVAGERTGVKMGGGKDRIVSERSPSL